MTALLVLSALAGLTATRSPAAPLSPAVSASKAAAPAVPATSPSTTTSPVAGACSAGSGPNAAGAAASAALSAATPAAPSPSTVLFNSAVSPYAVWTGPYGYVSKGAALRDLGYGQIDLTWPGPGTSKLVAAYLIWSILNDSTPPSTADVNGHPIVGTWTAYATPSPCWSPTYIYTFAADVTPYVVNGLNNITNVPSNLTNGQDPWADDAADETGILDDGASLVAIYDAGTTTTQEVTVYTGAETTEGGSILETLNYTAATAESAETTFIVADGQLPDNSATWNGTLLQENAFPGDDPKETSIPWSQGNLSDTKTYDVQVEVGSTSSTAEIASGESDCLTWTGQVVSVQVAPQKPPYTVTFEEQGLNAGTQWTVTIDSNSESGTVSPTGSAIVFTLDNGSFPYQVTGIPGYAAQYSGTVTVDGGNVFLRVDFHVVLYAIVFTESGLPSDYVWWSGLYNATDVNIENASVIAPATITYQEPNGSYRYYAGEDGLYVTHDPKGSIDVDGKGDYQYTITFQAPELYAVNVTEHGLVPGTRWGGTVYSNFGEYYPSTTYSSFVVELPNTSIYGSDSVTPTIPTGYGLLSGSSIGFQVLGAPVDISVDYTELFTVQFNETGLPYPTYWQVNVTGPTNAYLESEYRSQQTQLENGSYTFTVSRLWGYLPSPATGTFDVAAKNVTVNITFVAKPTYTVAFNETGLGAGTAWSILLYLPNGTEPLLRGTGASIEVALPNGSYDFYVEPLTGFANSPTYAGFTVDGANVTEHVHFAPVFKVQFLETGLPSGWYWYGYLNDTFDETDATTLTYTVANGTYSFTIDPSDGFEPTPSTGSVTVSGPGTQVHIVFADPTYPTYNVRVTESGLAAGTNWSASFDDYENWSTGSSMNFTSINGSYPLYVYDVGDLTPSPSYEDVEVYGAPVVEDVVYGATEYAITFSETGLPTNTEWTVTLTDVETLSSTGETVVFMETAGSYDYTVHAEGYVPDPASGPVSVTDAGVSIDVAFTPYTYEVTFSETGLASGTSWWVNVSGGPSLEFDATSGVAPFPNGTFDYTVGTTEKTEAAPPGSFAVDAGPTSVPITFSPVTYTVTFTETGLAAGATWWVNISTSDLSLKVVGATSTSIPLSNGTYAFTAGTTSPGLKASGGSFAVKGVAKSVTIAFGTHSGSSSTGLFGLPGSDGYYLLGALFALFLMLVLLAARRRRKDKKQGVPGQGNTAGNPPPPPGQPPN